MNAPALGTLYLVPNTLDFGLPASTALPDLQDAIPLGVIAQASRLGHWVAENAKTTRAFLKRVDAVVPLAQPLQSLSIVELPRPPKGGNPKPMTTDWVGLLEPARQGHDIGLISEAGLPGVADPGAQVVHAAHQAGLRVVALSGPSSLMLALAASGLQGQSFAFVGYLPVEGSERSARIRALESTSRREGQTQLMIETPYRNEALLSALVATLQPGTRLSVSCGLTVSGGFTRTARVSDWKKQPTRLPPDIPAVFSLLASDS